MCPRGAMGRGLCALVGPWGRPVCACPPRAMGRGLCALVWSTGGCVPGSVN